MRRSYSGANQTEVMMKLFLGLFLGFCAAAVSAEEFAPDAQVKAITDDVIAIVRQDKDLGAFNQKKVSALVDAKVLPYFDFARMTAIAVGRNWPKASPEQQKLLTGEFRTLLVRTYSSALSSYKNQVIEVKPLRAAAGDSEVTVRTQIKQTGTEPISIDYSLEKTPAGWKIYDVVVGGVSLVATYRESFTVEIRNGGVDGLIKSLASKNRSLDGHLGAKPA